MPEPYATEEQSAAVVKKEPDQFLKQAEIAGANKFNALMFDDVNRWLINPSSGTPILGLTKDIIDAHILDVHYFTGDEMYRAKAIPVNRIPLAAKNLTICHIVTTTGSIFIGESTCLDIRKFDADVGKSTAYGKAYTKLADFLALVVKAEQFKAMAGHIS